MRLTLYGDEMTDTTISMDSAIKRYEVMKSDVKKRINEYGLKAHNEDTGRRNIDNWN